MQAVTAAGGIKGVNAPNAEKINRHKVVIPALPRLCLGRFSIFF